jgi:transcriptional regulator with XRE-family HTH domain
MVVGGKLRLLREEADLDRAKMATLIGCSEGHLRNVESNRNDIARHQLDGRKVFRISRILTRRLEREVSIDEFTTETEVDGEMRQSA